MPWTAVVRKNTARALFRMLPPCKDGVFSNSQILWVPPFATVWEDFVEELADITAQGLDAGDTSTSKATYAHIFLVADALACSRFLKTLMKDRNLHRKGRAEKLKRRLNKVRQYASGTHYLIEKAKRPFPIPHRWEPLGHGHFDRHGRVCIRPLQ